MPAKGARRKFCNSSLTFPLSLTVAVQQMTKMTMMTRTVGRVLEAQGLAVVQSDVRCPIFLRVQPLHPVTTLLPSLDRR